MAATADQLQEVAEAYSAHSSQRKAAKSLDMPISTFRSLLKKAMRKGYLDQYVDAPGTSAKADVDRKQGKGWLELTDYEMPSPEDVLEKHNLDPAVWRVTRVVPNQWQGFYRKRSEWSSKKGAGKSEREHQVVTMYSLRVYVERFVAEPIEQAIERIASRVQPLPKPTARSRKRRPELTDQLCVFGLYDLHIGAMSWAGETDEDNDTKKAVDRAIAAIDHLIESISHHPIRKCMFVFGNDLMHYDNERGETTSGNVITDFDTRYSKTFECCHYVNEYGVQRCLEVADEVEGIVVPGNHARKSEYALAKVLEMRFRDDPRVSVDASPKLRKYRLWGGVLLGFTHFDRMNVKDGYRLMAEEAREHWAHATCRELHGGHYHNRKQIDQVATQTEGKVTIRQNPSLTTRDLHAYRHGYEAVRCADVYRYNRYGLAGIDTTYAETA